MDSWPAKDPDEQRVYTRDWSMDLLPGETITNATFLVVDDAGTTVVGDDFTDTTSSATISGGNDGQEAHYTSRIQTSADNILEVAIALPIVAKVDAVDHPGDYSFPTASNLLALYPEFAEVRPSLVEYYLKRAGQSVDTSWREADYGHGLMTLAAHLMASAGLGSSAQATSIANGSAQFKAMAIGTLRLDRFDAVKDATNLSATRYGVEYKRLLRVNRGGPRVTGSLPGGWGDGDKAW